jgi:electron transfer flavoprotein beta subunit
MRIIVCIKQVPATTDVAVDETTGVLKREGIKTRLNPYDLYALETALRLRGAHGGEITALTMGPLQARSVIAESFMMGVDHGYLISDRAFAGADVWATARAISESIKLLGDYDLIICGKQTTDGDTAQVGPEIAELLGIPHLSNVLSLGVPDKGSLPALTDMGDSRIELSVRLPALITVEKGINTPRLPSYRRKQASAGREIPVIALSDLAESRPELYGLRGSPTQVERVFVPEADNTHEVWEDAPAFLARRLVGELRGRKLL